MTFTTHTHTCLTALFPGLPGWAGTRKIKPIWVLLKQETVSGSGISWATCKSAPRSRQITTPAPHHLVFFIGRMPFLPPNQQCQSTEGVSTLLTLLQNNLSSVFACVVVELFAGGLNHSGCCMSDSVMPTDCVALCTGSGVSSPMHTACLPHVQHIVSCLRQVLGMSA